jgi:hypothetical protein
MIVQVGWLFPLRSAPGNTKKAEKEIGGKKQTSRALILTQNAV